MALLPKGLPTDPAMERVIEDLMNKKSDEYIPAAEEFGVCIPVKLPMQEQVQAALTAIEINPMNRPPIERLATVAFMADFEPTPDFLAVLTTKYWGAAGARLTVGFMESIQADLRNRIMSHLNAWNKVCNAEFVWTQGNDAQIRISRGNGGYWSYLGTDNLHIPRNQQTMNLQGFTMNSPEREFVRVIRHEAGHALGFPHEHMRRELIEKLDERKTIEYFRQTQNWSPAMTRSQVLTPLEESSMLGTDHADDNSIMCYQLPGSITKDGRAIPGGNDIDAEDAAFANKVYPKPGGPVDPPPPPTGSLTLTLARDVPAGIYTLTPERGNGMPQTDLTPKKPSSQEFMNACSVALTHFRAGTIDAATASHAGWIMAGYATTFLGQEEGPQGQAQIFSMWDQAAHIEAAVRAVQVMNAQGPGSAPFDWTSLITIAIQLISEIRRRRGS